MEGIKGLFGSSVGAGWILTLIVLSQPILGVIAYQSLVRVNDLSSRTENQLTAIDPAKEILNNILLLDEFRGSCSALMVFDGFEASMNRLCTQRADELKAIYTNLPSLNRDASHDFFQEVTDIAASELRRLNLLYVESENIFDPQRRTYRLAFEVFRFYPRMMERLGQARGLLSKILFSDVDPKLLQRSKGGVDELGSLFLETMLLRQSDPSEYEAIVQDALDYIAAVDSFAEQSRLGLTPSEKVEGVSKLFENGTDMIRGLADSARHDALELEEALNSRLNGLKNEFAVNSVLFVFLQLVLVISAYKAVHSLKVVRASAEREREARLQLESTLDKQKEMFAIIGHELRTPVSTISMLAKEDSWSAENKIIQIQDISDNLLDVLEDLRVVVAPERALEAKKQQIDNPVSVIIRSLRSLEELVTKKEMILEVNMPVQKDAHYSFFPQPLRQSVTNLVKNAALHSDGSKVVVSTKFAPQTNGVVTATVSVEDDGKGIPSHLRESVFEAFGRGETSSEGSGLGLFIVKEMAKLMGGQLTYQESELGGAEFTLTFPMTPAVSSAAKVTSVPDSEVVSLSGMRILLAEDEQMLRLLTEKILTKENASVASYENGLLALNAFSPEDFDLVITDLMMPEMNGHELTRAIRERCSKTIVIAVTAAVMGAETEQFLHEGADYVLPKPITKESLKSALVEIKKARATQSHC